MGTIAITDIHDSFTENALSGLAVGDFVRCKCLVDAGEPCLLRTFSRKGFIAQARTAHYQRSVWYFYSWCYNLKF